VFHAQQNFDIKTVLEQAKFAIVLLALAQDQRTIAHAVEICGGFLKI
jgi:hypothetical protein